MADMSVRLHWAWATRSASASAERWLLLAAVSTLLFEVRGLRRAVERSHRAGRVAGGRAPHRSRAYRGHRRPEPGYGGMSHDQ